MRTLVAVPVMGSAEIGKISLYQWDRTASPDCHFLLIDNSPHPTQYEALLERGFLSPRRWSYVRNPENIGLIRSSQQAYNFALGMEADILVLTHNDVWVYPDIGVPFEMSDYWDKALELEFRHSERRSDMGVIGLFGSKGCSSSGHRLDTFGSLIEIAGHGRQMTEWIEPAVCLDGFFLACSMKMLDNVAGFDQRYQWHHVYDYDISLTSVELGYRNAVLNIPCHHLSGLTANNAAYATSGQDVHQANYNLWIKKWSAKLDLNVDANWNYKWEGGK
jgi:GT2 family glycosyltransferase